MVTKITREGVTIPDPKILNSLNKLKELLLESIDGEKIVYQKEVNIFDYDEQGIALLTELGLLRIIDYINSLKLDLEDSVEVYNRVITAVKTCEEKGFENQGEKEKIEEIIKWARK